MKINIVVYLSEIDTLPDSIQSFRDHLKNNDIKFINLCIIESYTQKDVFKDILISKSDYLITDREEMFEYTTSQKPLKIIPYTANVDSDLMLRLWLFDQIEGVIL